MDYNEEVVSKNEQEIIINWICNNWKKFKFNQNNGGYVLYINNLNEITNDYNIDCNIKNNVEKPLTPEFAEQIKLAVASSQKGKDERLNSIVPEWSRMSLNDCNESLVKYIDPVVQYDASSVCCREYCLDTEAGPLVDDSTSIISNQKMYNIFMSIKNRIVNLENLHDCKEIACCKEFVYFMKPGTKLHKHKDGNEDGFYHIRFNVIIQNAEIGGIPIYAGKKIKTIERCYILCRSGLDVHESTMIEGNKSKICISYGFGIDKKKTHLYPKIFKNKFIPR